MKSSSLQSRITFAMWFVTLLSTLTAALLSGVLLVRSHKQSIQEQLQTAATGLVSLGISDFSELKDFEQLDTFIEDTLQMEKVDKIIRIFSPTKKLIFTTVHLDTDPLPDHLEGEIKKPLFQTIQGQRTYESLLVPYLGEKNKKTYYLQVIIPLPRYSDILNSLWWRSLVLMGLLITIAFLISNWLARRLIKPVGDIADHLREMDPMQIEKWQPLVLDERGQYLRAIADGINSLSERTRDAVLQIRKMSRFVAHEMRTPLTVLQGEAENALAQPSSSVEDYERVVKSSLEEIQRMSDTINTVLQIGEKARTMPLAHPEFFDLVTYVQDNKLAWARTLGGDLVLQIPDKTKVPVRIDAKLLFRLIDNLIGNIRKHIASGAAATLSVEVNAFGTFLKLQDQGNGLPRSMVDSLNTLGRSSKVAGVGLNLCYSIAEICGIRLQFSNRKEGGLCAEIRFN